MSEPTPAPDPAGPELVGPDPRVPGTPEEVGRRTHPLSALVQGLLYSAAATIALVGSTLTGGGWGDLHALISFGVAIVAGLVLGMIAGYVSWRFTRYVIDHTEVRVTTGFLSRASRRIPFERIQSVDVAEPLVARVFGLAELRIDSAGGSDSSTSIKYLEKSEVQRLRRVLLARAHGDVLDDDVEQPAEQRSLITRVPPERVVYGTLLSLDFVFAVVAFVALVVMAIWFDQVLVALGGAVSFGSVIVQMIGKRVLQQWNFTLSRGEHGLRIERGLLSRTSQTIPFDRVQGIAIKEPFVWRRLGWQRLEVDVAGYSSRSDDVDEGQVTTLLPITDPALAGAIIEELLPIGGPTVESHHMARGARLFAPIGWRYRSVTASPGVVIATTGWIQRTTSRVPHRKSQSVELRQGPLQRWRGVATVEIHTPPGPVDADGDHLADAEARSLWVAQVERTRTAG